MMLRRSLILVFLLLLLDQLLKVYIKTHYEIGQTHYVFGLSRFQLHFIENEGMAFGWKLSGGYGKLLLSLFRALAITGIAIYMVSLIRKKYHPGLILTVAVIMAGAGGNLIDSAFYGLIFSESTYFTTATMFPADGGYTTFLHGKVVDMLYFPLIEGTWPSWVPLKGGQQLIFFRPVFNLADSYISIGVVLLILFQRRFFTNAVDVSGQEEANTASETRELSSQAPE